MKTLSRTTFLSAALLLFGLADSAFTDSATGTCYRYCEGSIAFTPVESTYENCCLGLQFVVCPGDGTPGGYWVGGNPPTTEYC